MAKKAANAASQETPSLVKKAAAPRTRKHVKAQASGVVAAVEEFVSAIVHPAAVQPVAAQLAKPTATHEEISRLAFCFYMDRKGLNGSPAEDWIKAEKTLLG